MLLSALAIGCFLASAFGSSRAQAPQYETVYACEDQVVDISCPTLANGSEPIVNIVRANFGRFSIAICNDEGRSDYSVNCISQETKKKLNERCFPNGPRPSCKIVADPKVFGTESLCPETPKYLEVHYTCSVVSSGKIRDSSSTRTSSTITNPSTSVEITQTTFISEPAIESSNSNKRRIPITSRPKVSPSPNTTPLEASSVSAETVANGKTTGVIKEITSKFLSSSVASTNIMDTHEVTVTITNDMKMKKSENDTKPSTTFEPSTTLSPTDTTSQTTTYPSVASAVAEPHYSVEVYKEDTSNTEKPMDDHDEQPDDSTSSYKPKESYEKNQPRCPPSTWYGIEWPATRRNSTSTRPCPELSNGTAYWKCNGNSHWTTEQPDLSNCKSEWLESILRALDQPTSMVHLANDMEHEVASAQTFFGGDILGLLEAIEKMTDKMRRDLEQIPTLDQRRAVVSEVVQRIVKTVALITMSQSVRAWKELGGDLQTRKAVSKLINVVENAGLLLPEAVGENQEVTISAPNVLLSVKKLNFHHMGHTRFPSSAAVASKDWTGYNDHVEIPSLVLMEHMQRGRGITEIVFVGFKSLAQVLFDQQQSGKRPYSPIISLTMGRRVSNSKLKGSFLSSTPLVRAVPDEKLPEPITVRFEHKSSPERTLTNPICLRWDSEIHEWSGKGCHLTSSNETHTFCECDKLSTFALMQQEEATSAIPSSASAVGVLMWLIVLVLAVSLSLIFILALAAAIVFYRKSNMHEVNAHKRLESSPTMSGRLEDEEMRLLRPFSNFLRKIGLQQRRKRHVIKHRAQDFLSDPTSMSGNWPLHADLSTPTFATDTSRTFHRQHENYDELNAINPNRRANLHLDLDSEEPQESYIDRFSRPQRGATSGNRHGLSLTFHNYRRQFLPPKETVATPERPLLENDFPSPDTANHIYMEVDEPQPFSQNGLRYGNNSLQPIHRPLQTLIDSSSSSQSSGYASSASPHGVPLSGFNYDNVRGALRGPFVQFPGSVRPESRFQSCPSTQSNIFVCQQLRAPSDNESGPETNIEDHRRDIYLQDSQFV